MPEELSQNARLSAAVIEAAIRNGVEEWVVGAGARNIPLLQTLLSLPEDRRGKVWNFFEERSAAFFALGRAKVGGKRIAVVTTSGTAAAELLPATIEAHYSGQSLLLITADRPPDYRGTGAPQAIEQRKLFTPYVWRTVDWADESDWKRVSDVALKRSPEHWNVCLEEPSPSDQIAIVRSAAPDLRRVPVLNDADKKHAACVCAFCSDPGDMVVLLGELSQDERVWVEPALENLGAPIWAEATSGLRESETLRPLTIRDGEKSLAALNPKRVLRIGGVPSLRFWRDLENRTDIEVMSLTRTGFSGLARDSQVFKRAGDIGEGSDGNSQVDFGSGETLGSILNEFPAGEPSLFRRLSEQIDSDALVFLGNSLPIREWNLAASFDVPHPYCAASRGANGIDGQVSTFLGMCADTGNSPSGAWAVFGDLTTMYDLSAPWVLPQLDTGCKRRIVVINNGGGRIFDRLPAVREASDEQAAVIRNAHAHDFQHWAAMWGMNYACWTADDEWVEPEGEAVVIELRPDEAQTEAFWNQWDSVKLDRVP